LAGNVVRIVQLYTFFGIHCESEYFSVVYTLGYEMYFPLIVAAMVQVEMDLEEKGDPGAAGLLLQFENLIVGCFEMHFDVKKLRPDNYFASNSDVGFVTLRFPKSDSVDCR